MWAVQLILLFIRNNNVAPFFSISAVPVLGQDFFEKRIVSVAVAHYLASERAKSESFLLSKMIYINCVRYFCSKVPFTVVLRNFFHQIVFSHHYIRYDQILKPFNLLPRHFHAGSQAGRTCASGPQQTGAGRQTAVRWWHQGPPHRRNSQTTREWLYLRGRRLSRQKSREESEGQGSW